MLPSPFFPCQNSAVISFWNSGCCAPAATGMSHRLASETMRSAFSRPIAAVTFPGTTVIARTSSSGEFSASIRARASSVPGSVSKIIFLAAEAGKASTATSPIVRRTGKAETGRRLLDAPVNRRRVIGSRKDWRCSLASWIWECQVQSAVLVQSADKGRQSDLARQCGNGCAAFSLFCRTIASKHPCLRLTLSFAGR